MSIAGFLGKLTLGIFRFTYVDEGTAKVVTRFGRYRKTLRPGLRGYLSAWGTFGRIHGFTVTDPATMKPKTGHVLDMKEIVFDYPEEKVISKDNVQFEIDAIVYFKIVDPRLALFNVDDYVSALRNTVQSILRAEIGRHSLEECYTSRQAISDSLSGEADKIAKAWGLDVIRLEIQEFDIGKFAEQLLRQKEQEIEKRQEILHAEGLKEAKIREAEAIKEYDITIAQGKRMAADPEAQAIIIKARAEAEAMKLRADAEAYTFGVVAEALAAHPEVLGNYLALHTAEEISKHLAEGQATKIFLPLDFAALIRALTSLGSKG